MYKKVDGNNMVFLVVYANDILLIEKDKRILSGVRTWLSNQDEMKDIRETVHVFGIKVMRDR